MVQIMMAKLSVILLQLNLHEETSHCNVSPQYSALHLVTGWCKTWTLDSGLDSWTGFWTNTAMGDDHFQPLTRPVSAEAK